MKDLSRAGKYEILERIGVGGFGTVYKGRDPFIKRTVAIKTCSTEDEGIRRRFLREAEIAGNLQHPNITLLYDFGYEEGIPYLVQEFLSGVDLQDLVDTRAELSIETKLDYLSQTAAGLLFAHENGVLHRDIKPGNLRLLDDGRVKILDFGIAKLASQETKLTHTGITLGTPAYLAPEQLRGEEVDPRADIYSFGVVAFELFTYQRMFDAASISALFYQILNEKGRRLSEVWQIAPPELETFLQRCTALERDDRFPSFREVLEALETLRTSLPEAMPTEAADPGATAVLSPDLIESVVEQERASAIENARSAVMRQVDDGNLAQAHVELARAVEKFGEIAPLRTLSERIAEVESQIAESDQRRRINSALDEIDARIAQGDLDSAQSRLSELEIEVPDRPELPGLRQRLDEAIREGYRERSERLTRLREQIDDALARGDFVAADGALRSVKTDANDRALVLELTEKIDQARLVDQVENAASKVRSALQKHRLDDAEVALEQARGQLGTHPSFESLANELAEARRLTFLDGEIEQIRRRLEKHELDTAESALARFRELHGDHPELASLEQHIADTRIQLAVRQAVEEISKALESESVEPAVQLLAAAVERHGQRPELAELSERLERRRRDLALNEALERIEARLEAGELDEAEEALASTRAELGNNTSLNLMESRVEALRMEMRVAEALDAVADALQRGNLDEAREILEHSRSELGTALEEHERFAEVARTMEQRLAEERAGRAASEIEKSEEALRAGDLDLAAAHARTALEIAPGHAEAQDLLRAAERARARKLEEARRTQAQRDTALAVEALLERGRLGPAQKRLAAGVADHGGSEQLESLEKRLEAAREQSPGLSPRLRWSAVAAALVLAAVVGVLLTRGGNEAPSPVGDSGVEIVAIPWARVVDLRDAEDRNLLAATADESLETPIFVALTPGTYTVTLELPGGLQETRPIEISAGARLRETVIPTPIDIDTYFESMGWRP